jgi:hypothetical protein
MRIYKCVGLLITASFLGGCVKYASIESSHYSQDRELRYIVVKENTAVPILAPLTLGGLGFIALDNCYSCWEATNDMDISDEVTLTVATVGGAVLGLALGWFSQWRLEPRITSGADYYSCSTDGDFGTQRMSRAGLDQYLITGSCTPMESRGDAALWSPLYINDIAAD